MIVGLGQTGLSVARYLAAQGELFAVADDNASVEARTELRALSPLSKVIPISKINPELTKRLWVSPGVPLTRPGIQDCVSKGVEVTGDIALFSDLAQAPIAAVTGSNGKSTVTAMLGVLAAAQLSCVAVAGNIGIPCLDVLADDVDYYVLELSSYQLDLVEELPLEVAGLLNLSPDHLDRYATEEAYFKAKLRIFEHARTAVIHKQLLDQTDLDQCSQVLVFADDVPTDHNHYGIGCDRQSSWLMKGSDVLMDCSQLQVLGRHNQLNALAALAMGEAMGLDPVGMVATLKEFKGLAHRCELIAEKDGVRWINDSKATNVAATLSAIDSLPADGQLILILGGESKGADFSLLQPALAGKVKSVLLLGEAKHVLASSLTDQINCEKHSDYDAVVTRAAELASAGDTVLLSPACSSLDMFSSYIARGEYFRSRVNEVLA